MNKYASYRKDIDGLRAIAVLSVIIFHINNEYLPGGFLGVDIFFVLSGYLITLILANEISITNTISIKKFYERRIKRIMPALLFMIVSTLLISFIIFAPNDFLAFSKSVIWSLFSAANIYFHTSIDTGYFSSGSKELPLLHLWSLGVEEQFYILWPFIVLWLLKYIKKLNTRLLVALVFFIASLTLAQSIITTHQSFAYYMLPTRAWELLAGSIGALLIHSGFKTKQFNSEVMAFIGFLSIVISLIFITESDPVPGIAAVPVIVGSVFLLISGAFNKTYIGKILSLKVFVIIGLLSYSAYLWHWPILAFLHYGFIKVDWLIASFVMILTFIMATISYYFIETPLRQKAISTFKVYFYYFLLPSIIIIAIAVYIMNSIATKSNKLYDWSLYRHYNTSIKPAFEYKYNCQFSDFDPSAFNDQRCFNQTNNKQADVFLIGDSNAAHYLGMIKVFSDHYKFSLQNATHSACPPLLPEEKTNINNKKYETSCNLYRATIFDEAIKHKVVIIAGAWNIYDREGGDKFRKSIKNTIQMLSDNTKHVIVLGKIPIFKHYNKECNIRSIRLPYLQCKELLHSVKDYDINTYLKKLSLEIPNVSYFDSRELICPNNQCSPDLNDTPIYFDNSHLSIPGSEKLGTFLIENNSSSINIFKNFNDSIQINE